MQEIFSPHNFQMQAEVLLRLLPSAVRAIPLQLPSPASFPAPLLPEQNTGYALPHPIHQPSAPTTEATLRWQAMEAQAPGPGRAAPAPIGLTAATGIKKLCRMRVRMFLFPTPPTNQLSQVQTQIAILFPLIPAAEQCLRLMQQAAGS